jgi:membrane protease YdiL (CAAX protease family)
MDQPELPPLVIPVAPKPPRPGFLQACVLTLGYWIALIGGMIAVVIVGLAIQFAINREALKEQHQEGATLVERMSPAIRGTLAWSLPAGYFAGFLYSVLALRIMVGRSWPRELGLNRFPKYHLFVGLLILPGFIVLSDTLARAVQPVDQFVQNVTGIGGLGDTGAALQALFADFHWSFAVFAIGLGPGVVEELWCRGFLGRGLLGRYGTFAGIALSSAFFGVLHLWPPSYVITTAAMGACLHLAYLFSRSLWVPIAMHFMNNSFAAIASVGVVRTDGMDAAIAAQPGLTAALATGLVLAGGLAMKLESATGRVLSSVTALVACAALLAVMLG